MTYIYDAEVDDLLISNKEENEKVKNNFLFDDFIISVTAAGKIVGLEIRNISKFLLECGISPEILKNLKEVELGITPKKTFISIVVSFNISENNKIIVKKIPITHIPVAITT